MTELLCPDKCMDPETGERRKFMNMQTLRNHLTFRAGVEGHPERTVSQIEGIIFNPDLLIPKKNNTDPTKRAVKIGKAGSD